MSLCSFCCAGGWNCGYCGLVGVSAGNGDFRGNIGPGYLLAVCGGETLKTNINTLALEFGLNLELVGDKLALGNRRVGVSERKGHFILIIRV